MLKTLCYLLYCNIQFISHLILATILNFKGLLLVQKEKFWEIVSNVLTTYASSLIDGSDGTYLNKLGFSPCVCILAGIDWFLLFASP